jgi:carbon-monoxide dehydrogenase large subunit
MSIPLTQKVAPCPIEPRSSAAYWDDDGRLVQYSSNQGAHPMRDDIAGALGLENDQVRVITPDVGGSFGSKSSAYPEDILLGPLSKRVGRPVRWTETRSESMVNLGHGRAQIQDVTIGGIRDGKITAYRLKVIQDSGAYPRMGAVLPFMTRMMTTGVYDVTNAEFSSESVATNTTPLVAFRGAGRPEAAAAIERAVDLFATEIGMDPADVRRRNLLRDDVFPYDTPGGATYDIGAYGDALELVLQSAGYDQLRAEQRARREAGDTKALGIGLSVYVEITALGGGAEYGAVELRADGTFLVTTGSSPYGQGHKTAWAMLVADRLGVPIESVEVIFGDTDKVPTGSVTGGSRSLQIAGSAIHDAAGKLYELARDAAADLLEANPDDLVLGEPDDGGRRRFHVIGTPAVSVGWEEIGQQTAADANPLIGLSDFNAVGPTFPFGAHVAVVEVDTETGAVELQRLVAVDDAGTILNPLLADGQVHGGLAQGAAQALMEEVLYDEDGNPLTTNFMDYAIISATELPMFERISMETPTPYNELGAKGIGESGTIGATPAVQNAVIDAVAHLGVRHIDMPCTPERVWRALNS